MIPSPTTRRARWALTALLLAGCGAQAGNNGGATNWLECNEDSDCASNACVERRCVALDAAAPPSSTESDDSRNEADAATASDTDQPSSESLDAATAPTSSSHPDASNSDGTLASDDSNTDPADPSTTPDASNASDAMATATSPDPQARPTRLALGERHACALFDDGTVWCWGNNDLGQLGDGSGESSLYLANTNLSEVAQLAAGLNHTCALKVNGEVWCWGDDRGEQLGRRQFEESDRDFTASIPGRATFDAGADWTLYAGGNATCTVERSTSHTVCWGSDPANHIFQPTQLAQIAEVFEESVASLTLSSQDFVFTNYSQRVYRIADWSSLVEIDPDIGSGSRAVLINADQQCRIKDDDSVWCQDENGTYVWQPELYGTNLVLGNRFVCQGLGVRRQCVGDNAAIPKLPLAVEVPEEVYGGAAALADHACSITVDGSIWCWGDRGVGEDNELYRVHEAALAPFPLQGGELSPTTGDDYVNAAIAQRQEQCRCEARELPSCYAETLPLATGACIDALRWATDVACATQQLWDQTRSGCNPDWITSCELPEAQPWLELCAGDDKQCPDADVTFAGQQWCDGNTDCPDGFDELNCVAASTYSCADLTTVDATLVCDGQMDCTDGSDELNCD